ncbi:MAG: hypothetical protein RI922_1079 [Bacteroidota bacterium]|jgi:hypothetical protein
MRTFNEWNEGIVTLNCTYYSKNINEQIEIVTLTDFDSQDQLRIKEAQKEYFHQIVHDETNRLIDAFIVDYNRSEFKVELLNKEVKQLFDILFAKIPRAIYLELKHWDTLIKSDELLQFRKFHRLIKIRGKEYDYSKQNSPFSPFFTIMNNHEVRYESFYRYYKFLEKVVVDADTFYNPFHWNENCFRLFKFLDNHVTSKTKKSKYGLIYHFLKAYSGYTKIKGIYFFDFSHSEYIEYITENYYKGFSKPTAPKMNKPDNFDEVLPKLIELEKLFLESQKTTN